MSKRAVLQPPRRARLMRGRWRVEPTAPAPVAPLGWEASFGGLLPDARVSEPPDNPLGTGLWLRAPRQFDEGTETDLPRIEGVGMDCARDPQAARSIGFGPVPRWWGSRIALAGTFDAAWRRERSPAMPADHDPGFLMSAPRDQWPDKPLVGGEPGLLDDVLVNGHGDGRDDRDDRHHDHQLDERQPPFSAKQAAASTTGCRLPAGHVVRLDLPLTLARFHGYPPRVRYNRVTL